MIRLSELDRFQHAHLVFRLARVTNVNADVAIEVANCMFGDMPLMNAFTWFGLSEVEAVNHAERVEKCLSN
jgi:hypothetical protein